MSRLASPARAALAFVVVIGVVSLFSDLTYEAARASNGAFLAVLGAGAAAVGIISGFGEWVGYLVRIGSGWLAGRTKRYWLVTGIGYVVQLFAVPALALAGDWQAAAGLIVLERIGKGIRNPPRDAMLAHAGTVIGQGWAFAVREALDQTGALVGPLIVTLVLLLHGGLRSAYALLLVPACLSLVALAIGRRLFPHPERLEVSAPAGAGLGRRLGIRFWTYTVAMGLVAFGTADFNLISFHLTRAGDPLAAIPALYALAMGTAGLSALVVGPLLDRYGLAPLMVAIVVGAAFAPLCFLGGLPEAIAGVALWGIGLGIQDSLLSAPIAMLLPASRRAYAIGVFGAVYGTAWFVGSSTLGLLYGRSLLLLVVVSVVPQLLAVPVLLTIASSLHIPGHKQSA